MAGIVDLSDGDGGWEGSKGSQKFISFDKLGILSQPGGGAGGSNRIPTFL